MVIGPYRQALTTVSSAGAEGRGSCQPQPESPSALFTVIKQHNIGHPTPQIKPHYIKEILDWSASLMHAHVKMVDRTGCLSLCSERKQTWIKICVYPPTLSACWQALHNTDAVFTWSGAGIDCTVSLASNVSFCLCVAVWYLEKYKRNTKNGSLMFRKNYHYLLSIMSFHTCMIYFVLWNTKDILKKKMLSMQWKSVEFSVVLDPTRFH